MFSAKFLPILTKNSLTLVQETDGGKRGERSWVGIDLLFEVFDILLIASQRSLLFEPAFCISAVSNCLFNFF